MRQICTMVAAAVATVRCNGMQCNATTQVVILHPFADCRVLTLKCVQPASEG